MVQRRNSVQAEACFSLVWGLENENSNIVLLFTVSCTLRRANRIYYNVYRHPNTP
jgi:hypothetical protein